MTLKGAKETMDSQYELLAAVSLEYGNPWDVWERLRERMDGVVEACIYCTPSGSEMWRKAQAYKFELEKRFIAEVIGV